MTEDFQRALNTFWAGFSLDGASVPAYIAGQVKKDAAFPYITFEVTLGAFASFNFLTATVWCKGESANLQRARILDEVAEALPEGGKKLVSDSGIMVLTRNAASFITMTQDPTDKSVIGGRVGYQINFYGI